MINHVTIYRKDTGQIVQYSAFSCQDGDILNEADNINARLDFFGSDEHGVISEPSDMFSHYVQSGQDGPVILDRPYLIVKVDKYTLTANGVDAITVLGLPSPCEIIQDPDEPEETRSTVTGGGFVFTAETPGTYQFRVDQFPFLPLNLEFIAT